MVQRKNRQNSKRKMFKCELNIGQWTSILGSLPKDWTKVLNLCQRQPKYGKKGAQGRVLIEFPVPIFNPTGKHWPMLQNIERILGSCRKGEEKIDTPCDVSWVHLAEALCMDQRIVHCVEVTETGGENGVSRRN